MRDVIYGDNFYSNACLNSDKPLQRRISFTVIYYAAYPTSRQTFTHSLLRMRFNFLTKTTFFDRDNFYSDESFQRSDFFIMTNLYAATNLIHNDNFKMMNRAIDIIDYLDSGNVVLIRKWVEFSMRLGFAGPCAFSHAGAMGSCVQFLLSLIEQESNAASHEQACILTDDALQQELGNTTKPTSSNKYPMKVTILGVLEEYVIEHA